MTKTKYYMGIAEAVAARSTCLKKQYGAVIVKDDRIVSTGYNGPPVKEPHCTVCTKKAGNKDFDEYCSCPAVHAEMNAIINASKADMQGATLYLFGYSVNKEKQIAAEPCEICLRLIKNSGIASVVNMNGTLYSRSEYGLMQKICHEVD